MENSTKSLNQKLWLRMDKCKSSSKFKTTLKELNDITLKELYYKVKVNKLINYQIFRNENDGISDTLLLFARGEVRQ